MLCKFVLCKVDGHSELMMQNEFVLWCSKLMLCYRSSSPAQTMLPHFQCMVPFKGSGGHACNTSRDQYLSWLKTLAPLLHKHWLEITRNCKANKHTRAAPFRFFKTSPKNRLQVLKLHGKLRVIDASCPSTSKDWQTWPRIPSTANDWVRTDQYGQV